MNCPKCGYQQSGGSECLRCGLVYAKLRTTPPVYLERRPGMIGQIAGGLWRFYKIFRWVTLAGLLLVLFLILRTSAPPVIAVPPDASHLAAEKVQRFVSGARHGVAGRLELDQPELNAWIQTNLALKKDVRAGGIDSQSIPDLAKAATNIHSMDSSSLSQAQSTVRDIKLELKDDLVLAYVVFDMHGMNMSMELEGHLLAEDGYLRLDPTGGKFGSLPLFSSTLHAAADRLFTSPGNKEKFKLPDYIRDIRIENSELIVLSQ